MYFTQISPTTISILVKLLVALYSIGWVCIYESIISTLLVAVYQFVSIRLDPFGTRNILTTPRCVATCVLTWIFSGGLTAAVVVVHNTSYGLVTSLVFGLLLVITSVCYILIYYGVSKVPSTDNVQMRQRKAENKRVLRTFGLILGTTAACLILPLAYWIMFAYGHINRCISIGAEVMLNINLCANSLIYWWRLKEFRSVCCVCRGRQGARTNLVV